MIAPDLVVGSRLDAANRQTMPFLHRFIGTPVLTFLTARACGRRVVTDSQSGFRAFRRGSLTAMKLSSPGMELASEMLIIPQERGCEFKRLRLATGPESDNRNCQPGLMDGATSS